MTSPSPQPRVTSAVSIRPGRFAGERPPGQGEEARRAYDQPDDGKNLVATEGRDESPARDRGDDHAAHHGRQHQARTGRGGAEHNLEKEGQENEAAEEGHRIERDDADGDNKDAIGEEMRWQDRFARAPFLPDEQAGKKSGDDGQGKDDRRQPGINRSAPTEEQEQGNGGAGEKGRADVIDAMFDDVAVGPQPNGDEKKRRGADGQVNVKDPAPGKGIGDEAAEDRSRHAARGEDGAEEALVASALARHDQVAHGGLRKGDESARAEALEGAKKNELEHGLRQAAEGRADEEDDDRGKEKRFAPIDVAELAVEGHGDGRGDHEGGDDPGEMGDAAQVADDAWQRGADDVLIQRGERKRHHQPGKNRVEFALGGGRLGMGKQSHGRNVPA